MKLKALGLALGSMTVSAFGADTVIDSLTYAPNQNTGCYGACTGNLFDPAQGVIGGGPTTSTQAEGGNSFQGTRSSQVTQISGANANDFSSLGIGGGIASLGTTIGSRGTFTLFYSIGTGLDVSTFKGAGFEILTDLAGPGVNNSRIELFINSTSINNLGSAFGTQDGTFGAWTAISFFWANGTNTITSFAIRVTGLVDGADISIRNLQFQVPEPASFATLGGGLLLVAFLARRRK
jgi:hypothetical protein